MDDKVVSHIVKFNLKGVGFFIRRKFRDKYVYLFEEEDSCVCTFFCC